MLLDIKTICNKACEAYNPICSERACPYAEGWRKGAKAQLIADWDWFNEPCKEHSLTWVLVCLSGLLPNTIYTDVYNDNKIFYSHRYLCPDCRAEFEAEYKKIKSEVKG